MLKILTVIGARPQFIKAATVSRVVASRADIKEVIVHTGQHFDINMSEIFFSQMEIPLPAYNLNISSLGHGAMTGKMLESLEEIMIIEKPDWVLVYGDTNSTLAGALAASKLHINIAHVEAGLRSNNMSMPEEVNRILTDRLSKILFCPSTTAVENLELEGYGDFDLEIHNFGDVMYDAALFYSKFAKKPVWLNGIERFALSTIHRAENTDDAVRLREIILALNEVHKKCPVVLPLHPRTKKMVDNLGIELNVFVVDPVGYLEMVYLLKNCEYVVSDSGGLQKEAYFFKKQCFILRDETEWIELVKYGINTVVGADFKAIISAIANRKSDIDFGKRFYGDGQAASGIIDKLVDYSFSNP